MSETETDKQIKVFYLRAAVSAKAIAEWNFKRQESTEISIFLRPRGFPVACVASMLMDDQTVKFAVSTCNPKDIYNRHLARTIAIGRLKSGDNPYNTCVGAVSTTAQLQEVSPGAVKMNIMKAIAYGYCGYSFPQQARDAAKIWLKRAEELKGDAAPGKTAAV